MQQKFKKSDIFPWFFNVLWKLNGYFCCCYCFFLLFRNVLNDWRKVICEGKSKKCKWNQITDNRTVKKSRENQKKKKRRINHTAEIKNTEYFCEICFFFIIETVKDIEWLNFLNVGVCYMAIWLYHFYKWDIKLHSSVVYKSIFYLLCETLRY